MRPPKAGGPGPALRRDPGNPGPWAVGGGLWGGPPPTSELPCERDRPPLRAKAGAGGGTQSRSSQQGGRGKNRVSPCAELVPQTARSLGIGDWRNLKSRRVQSSPPAARSSGEPDSPGTQDHEILGTCLPSPAPNPAAPTGVPAHVLPRSGAPNPGLCSGSSRSFRPGSHTLHGKTSPPPRKASAQVRARKAQDISKAEARKRKTWALAGAALAS